MGSHPKYFEVLKQRLSEKNLLIQVILGPRQIGKTTFMTDFVSQSPSKYLFVSGDGVQDSFWIEHQWAQAEEQGKILVIDEVQKIPNWSESIKKCWDAQKFRKNKIKCVLLGSSSLTLQKGLSESLTGRFELIRAFHWDFQSSSQLIKKISIDDYLIYGGYPGSYSLRKDSHRWEEFLRSSIVETVIGKDILMQARVKSPALFRQCFYVLMNLPAQVLSYNKILGQLQDRGNIDLVKYYIELFEGAYLLKALQKYSKNEIGKRQSSPKIISMAPALNTFHRMDNLTSEYMGRVFESLVGAQLLRHKENIFYWSEGDYEVDFVLELQGKLIAIEVKSGKKRKSSSLEVFTKKYPAAKVIFITKENYPTFEKDPLGFLSKKL